MVACRLRLIVVALLCGLACLFATGAVPAVAGATQFGSRGVHAGEFNQPFGVAIDQESSDVYVSDKNNYRIDKFDGSGNFLLTWGWDVNEENPANELQTCLTSCRAGQSGTGAGEFASEGSQGVAVDNNPPSSSPSSGDVYAVDWENFRVEKFDSSGKFLLMFGGGVDEATSGDVCIADEACRAGTEGPADGQFEWAYRASFIAVGPGGRVYVGDKARVQVFEPSGAWKENISLAGLSATGKVKALAVDASGDVFVKDEGVPGVREFNPGGTEKTAEFDTGSESVEAIALDGSGDLFVGDSSGGFHVLEYDSAGNELASFGSKTLTASGGMAFSNATGELYVSGEREFEGPINREDEPKVWVLTVPSPGPLVEPGSASATPGLRGTATLEASVNPEGNETTYRFEYVDEAHFQTSGYASASSTPPVSIGSGFEDRSASSSLTGLVPGAIYHYRILASNSKGTTSSADRTFTETPPALVDGPWAANVASTSATLAAEIDPLGASTEYRLEYGTSTSYGHVLSGDVGEGMANVSISYHRQELEPDTTYHYRLVTNNEVGTVEGLDHTFTTQVVSGQGSMLPDGRAWELVSPPDKKGAAIELFNAFSLPTQAASDGSGIIYLTQGPQVGEDPGGRSIASYVLSRRGSGGWKSEDITLPRRALREGEQGSSLIADIGGGVYYLFSQDLSLAVAEPTVNATPLLSSEATERTLYLRNDTDGSFLPLVTATNVPPGTKFGGKRLKASLANCSWSLLPELRT